MLKKFCCMRLRTAGTVIGYLGLVGSVLSTIAFCSLLIYTGVNSQIDDAKDMKLIDVLIYNDVQRSEVLTYSIGFGISVIQLMSSAMLILGTMKKRHLMLLPWLVNSCFVIATTFLSALCQFYVVVVTPQHSLWRGALTAGKFIWLAITIYMFVAIYSLYKEIQFANDQKKQPMMMETKPKEVPQQPTTYPNYVKM